MVITYQLHDPNKIHSSCFKNYSLGLVEQLQVSRSNQMVKLGRSIGRFLLEKSTPYGKQICKYGYQTGLYAMYQPNRYQTKPNYPNRSLRFA